MFNLIAQYSTYDNAGSAPLALSAASPALRQAVELSGSAYVSPLMRSSIRRSKDPYTASNPSGYQRCVRIAESSRYAYGNGEDRRNCCCYDVVAWWIARERNSLPTVLAMPVEDTYSCGREAVDFGKTAPLITSLTFYSSNANCRQYRESMRLPPTLQACTRVLLSSLCRLDLSGVVIACLSSLSLYAPLIEVLWLVYLDCVTQDYSPLGLLKHLKDLNLSKCNVSSIEWIRGCAALEKLNMAGCDRVAGLQAIGSLSELRDLCLDNCGTLKTISWIRPCTWLTTLSIAECEDDDAELDLSPLASLPRLASLNLSCYTQLTNMAWIADCAASLTVLNLSAAMGVSNFGVLAPLHKLTYLDLSQCYVVDISWVPQCSRLEKLLLAGCQFIEDYTPLQKLPMLIFLDVSRTAIADVSWAPPHLVIFAESCYNLPDWDGESTTTTTSSQESASTDTDHTTENDV